MNNQHLVLKNTLERLLGSMERARPPSLLPPARQIAWIAASGIKNIDFQMRDLRAKAGTDKAESGAYRLKAKDQRGHASVVMTEQCTPNRKGKVDHL